MAHPPVVAEPRMFVRAAMVSAIASWSQVGVVARSAAKMPVAVLAAD
jgi:hypothetical protein